MTIVKSFSVGDGDMFAIRHHSDNFTIIDCCISDEKKCQILRDIETMSSGKKIKRFISTHPDADHIGGLNILYDKINILNFYCVKNQAKKENINNNENFERAFGKYCELRGDNQKVFYLHKNCKRRWMNISDDKRDDAGIQILWPDTNNLHFKEALEISKNGGSPNNISPIILLNAHGFKFMWMGDLERDFMKKIIEEVELQKINVLFAPHHGRDSGKVPKEWLEILKPELIVIGEAPSEYLNYYKGYDTITQNSAGDITFEVDENGINIYVSNYNYSTKFQDKEFVAQKQKSKIGDTNLCDYSLCSLSKK